MQSQIKKIFYILMMLIFATVSFADNTKIYTEKDQSIILDKNTSEFTIQLKSNPTTGYSWFLQSYNSNIIQPVSHQYVAENPKLIGSGGMEVWKFKVNRQNANVPQTATLVLVYSRPWEKAPGETLTYSVFIN